MFYVSDSFTVFPNSGDWITPGPFNQDRVWSSGEPIQVTWTAGECAHIVFGATTAPQGSAMDVYVGLYQISSSGGATSVPNSRLKFVTSTGGYMSEAVCMNSISQVGLISPVSGRYLSGGVSLGLPAPTSSGVYQVGLNARFFMTSSFNGVPIEFQYFMQGITS